MDKFNGWDDAPRVSPMKSYSVVAYVVVMGIVGGMAIGAVLALSACIVSLLLGGPGCMS